MSINVKQPFLVKPKRICKVGLFFVHIILFGCCFLSHNYFLNVWKKKKLYPSNTAAVVSSFLMIVCELQDNTVQERNVSSVRAAS